MNVDVGGGTSKIAVCADGRVTDLTALDVGARLICLDPAGRIVRVEEAGRRFGADLGIDSRARREARAREPPAPWRRAWRIACSRPWTAARLRRRHGTSAARCRCRHARPIDQVTFSGGVAEYIYGREAQTYGDLGVLLAQEIRIRVESRGAKLEPASEGIRATVIGASQYTTQVSGSTIYVSPLEALPLRNVPVIAPAFALDGGRDRFRVVAAAIKTVLKRLDLAEADTPVAVFVPWRGSATFQRLDAFCQGVVDGLAGILADDHPLVLAGDGDVGGLMGIHLREEMQLDNAIVSVDGLELKEFDYIDIGAMLPNSGAVPVVIKSLIFPGSAAVGMEWQPCRGRDGLSACTFTSSTASPYGFGIIFARSGTIRRRSDMPTFAPSPRRKLATSSIRHRRVRAARPSPSRRGACRRAHAHAEPEDRAYRVFSRQR